MSEPIDAQQTPTVWDVAIVGAGIIGLACAWALQRRGLRVLLLDREGIAEMTSRGNAGAIAVSDILPLASPGIIRKAPKWLLDPLGPLAIPLPYFPRILPWLWHFWRASSPSRVEAGVAALAALMALSETETMALFEDLGLTGELRPNGAMYLYESEREFRRALPGWRRRDEHGIPYTRVSGEEIRALEPALSPCFIEAIRVEQWLYVSDPYKVSRLIGERLIERGATFRKVDVRGVAPEGAEVVLRLADDTTLRARRAVIAAGAWSHHLTGPLGEPLPLECERGYNTTLPAPGLEITHELIFEEHGFVAVQLDSGLRIGGADELAGLTRPPNYARAEAMLRKAQRFLPGLNPKGGVQWMGHRPSLPDSLPAIGHAQRSPNIIYAFGHGHLGLTQSAATGRLVAELATDQAPAIDLHPFHPGRF
jgi:D-amino-acid dehydrogenase